MAYTLTRAEVMAVIDMIEDSTKPSERTPVEQSALLTLHKILEAHNIVRSRLARTRGDSHPLANDIQDDMDRHELDQSIKDRR